MGNPIETRDTIIKKAIALFNTKGYRATSLSDITKATGLTKGAIYGNFENKDAVAVAAYEYAAQKVIDQLTIRIKAAPTAPLKLKAIAHYYTEYVTNPPIQGGCPVINTSIEADDNYPLLRLKVVQTMAMIKESFKKIIHRGISEGQIKKDIDVEAFANVFYATIKGGIMISLTEGNATTARFVSKEIDRRVDEISL
ncbi:TetR/AcrR family transcriptional regulator [Marinoscillum sp. MHG1-6]|uniref:TetR/AcrR family transcriptional regulator n=1 Tax=Marinoscillum sp. MHG1-6 TaxID=2959627 RepID=UPI002157594B|nr:TetR/AcrR family transcriptional regulator [Marinoscillum sp. MHG1-6]